MKIYSAQFKGTTTVATGSNVDLTGSFSGSIAGIDINATNQFTASTSTRLTNIEIISASNINRIISLETKSASVDISISNINAVTASNIARLSNLETKSSSVDISVSSINSKTGSYATTGSNTFFGTQTYSGSVYIANDLIVQGSSSIQYISASSVSIGTNIVQLNTANPSVRFAGLTIIDSGSIGGSGSFLYDSVHDEFVFVHRGNGTNVTSSHFVLGPETYDSLGNETYLTCNLLTKGTGKEHLVDSCIFDNGTTTCIKNNLIGMGTACFGNAIAAASTISIGGADQGYQLDVKKSSTGDSTFDTIANFYKTSTNSTQLLIRAKNGLIDLAGSYVIGGGGPNTGLSFSVSPSAGSPTEAMRITSSGVTCFSSTICACGLDLVNTGRTTLRIFSGPADNEPGVEWWSSYPSAAERNWRIGTSDKEMGDFVIKSTTTCGTAPDSGCIRIHINNSGVVCFSCQICTAGLYSNCAIGINSYNSAIPLQIKRWVGSSGTALLIGNDNVVGMPALSFCNDNGGGTAYVSMTSNCQININGSIYACPSGYVGIGTSSPTVDLSVKPGVDNAAIRVGTWAIMENVTTNQTMFGYNTAYATGLGTGWRYINNGYAMGIRMHDAYGSGDIMFHLTSCGTAGTNLGGTWDGTDLRMIIKNDGKVGIGTITPVASLHVVCVPSSYYGIIETTGCSTGTVKHFRLHKPGCVEYGIGILDNNSFHISTASTFPTTNGFTITSGGRVGIGTTTINSETLTINQTTGGASALYVYTTGVTTGQSYGLTVVAGTNSSDRSFAVFSQSSTEYLKVRGDGYLFSTPTYNNQWPGYSANMYIASDGSMGRITASSCRFKENIIDWSGNGLDTILALKPKTFKYKKDYVNSDLNFLGLIAEDVAEVLPYLAEYENPDRTGLVENVRYDTIVVPLIAAIQEQQCTICSQASMINLLKSCIGIV